MAMTRTSSVACRHVRLAKNSAIVTHRRAIRFEQANPGLALYPHSLQKRLMIRGWPVPGPVHLRGKVPRRAWCCRTWALRGLGVGAHSTGTGAGVLHSPV